MKWRVTYSQGQKACNPATLDQGPWTRDPTPEADQTVRFIPMKRTGRPDEAAPLALYLASDASGYVTGQVLFVDGGLTVHL